MLGLGFTDIEEGGDALGSGKHFGVAAEVGRCAAAPSPPSGLPTTVE
jgi:hypothetical protein